jgi:hypothetical protein
MPLKHSNTTNRREVTSTCSTYRPEVNLRVSVTFSLKEEHFVIKLWPHDVISCVCITKMKGWQNMVMQKAQVWRNKKIFQI